MRNDIAVNHKTALNMAWNAGVIGNERDMEAFNAALLKINQPTKGYWYPLHVVNLIKQRKAS